MNYRLRPGVVLTSICGVNLLIPSRAAAHACPQVLRLPLMTVLALRVLDSGTHRPELIQAFMLLQKCSETEAEQQIEALYAALADKGYLIREDPA